MSKVHLVGAVCVVAAAIGAVSIGFGLRGQAGEPVRVFLRHGGSGPGTSTQESSGGGMTSYSIGPRANAWPSQVLGYLERRDDDWVVVRAASEDDAERTFWIPTSRVQLIEHVSEDAMKFLAVPPGVRALRN